MRGKGRQRGQVIERHLLTYFPTSEATPGGGRVGALTWILNNMFPGPTFTQLIHKALKDQNGVGFSLLANKCADMMPPMTSTGGLASAYTRHPVLEE